MPRTILINETFEILETKYNEIPSQTNSQNEWDKIFFKVQIENDLPNYNPIHNARLKSIFKQRVRCLVGSIPL